MRGFEDLREFARSFAEVVDIDGFLFGANECGLGVVRFLPKDEGDLLRFGGLLGHDFRLPIDRVADRRYDVLSGRWVPTVVRGGRKFSNVLKLFTGMHFACPYPLSFDPYAGFCPFRCVYCYAMGSSLPILVGLFSGAPSTPYKVVEERRIEELLLEGHPSSITVGFRLAKWLLERKGFTLKVGLRGEVFSELELRHGRMLKALRLLRSSPYCLAINTKSTMWWRNRNYREALLDVADKVVIILSITAPRILSERVKKFFEPGAPTIEERFRVLREFAEVGGRVAVFFVPPLVLVRGFRVGELVRSYMEDILEAYPDRYRHKVVEVQGWRTTGVPLQQYGKMSSCGFSVLGLHFLSGSWIHSVGFNWFVWSVGQELGVDVAMNDPVMRLDFDRQYLCEGIEEEFRYNPVQWLELGRWIYGNPGKVFKVEEIYWRNGFREELDDYLRHVLSGTWDYLSMGLGIRIAPDLGLVYDRGVEWEELDNPSGYVLRYLMSLHPDYRDLIRDVELKSPLLENELTVKVVRNA